MVSKGDKEIIQRVKLINYILKSTKSMDNAFLKQVWESNEYKVLLKSCSMMEDSEAQI